MRRMGFLDEMGGYGSSDQPWLALEEGKENCCNGADLADPEDKHPLDEVGSDTFDLSFNLGEPFLKPFLSHFQHSLLRSLFYLVENLHKDIRAFICQALLQDSRNCDNRHGFLLQWQQYTMTGRFNQVRGVSGVEDVNVMAQL